MGDKKIYVIAKIFDQQGCIAYRCKTVNEARCLPRTLEAIREEGAPYNYIENVKDFVYQVGRLNKAS